MEWLVNSLLLRSDASPGDMPAMPLVGMAALKYALPKDSGKKVALIRLIFNKLAFASDILVWVNNSNVFPSSGHIPLLLSVRSAGGVTEPLDRYPGLLFNRESIQDAISVTILAAEFFWDCLVAGDGTEIVLFLSHDEYYCLMSRNVELLHGLKEYLASRNFGQCLE